MSEIVSKLRKIQLAKRLTDGEMAQQLNCSRQTYQKTRVGKIKVGNKILMGIMAAFPELKQDIIYFLSNDANRFPKDATKNPLRRLLEAQGRGLKRFFGGLLARIKNLPFNR